MKIGLYADNTLPLDVPRLCEVLDGLCSTASFIAGEAPFRLTTDKIASPSGDETLPDDVLAEVSGFDLSCLATNVPYDNNHFFDSLGSNTIVSFSGWNSLTDLPIANGFAYFIASILSHVADIGATHHENTGCINDFWWDKTGVDIGMRAAFICGDCLRAGSGADSPRSFIDDIQALLNAVSVASRGNENFLEAPLPGSKEAEQEFDVFLCHNSDDKPAIRAINGEMKAVGIRTWFDEEQLPPGMPWQPELEQAIGSIRSACVFVGASGLGPWQRNETRAFLDEFDSENLPVIPVLLPEAGGAPELPIFLRQRTWIDLRDDYQSNLSRLAAFLTGSRR